MTIKRYNFFLNTLLNLFSGRKRVQGIVSLFSYVKSRSFLSRSGPTEAKTRNQEQNRARVQLYSWKEREREGLPGVKDTLGIVSGNVIAKPERRRLESLALHYVTKLCLRSVFFTGAIVKQSPRREKCALLRVITGKSRAFFA